MSSDPNRRRRLSPARIARVVIAALCAASLTLALLVAPSAGLAQSPHFDGTLPARLPPGPPPVPPGGGGGGGGGGGRFPCRGKQCLEIVKQFCKAVEKFGGCAELAKQFLDTKKGDPRDVLGNKDHPEQSRDLAFRPPFLGVDFEVHHIVPQGNNQGVPNFAQAILQRVGIKLNDPSNLAALRGPKRKRGMKGYNDLSTTADGRILQKRLAHADAQTRFYYQTVNDRFAQLIKRTRNHPTKAQVEALLQEIKNKLYNGDTKFIAPGKAPRARDLLRL